MPKFWKWLLAAAVMFNAHPAHAAVDLLDIIPDEEEPLLQTTCVQADAYVKAAIDQASVIYLPAGCLKFNAPLHIKKTVHIIGEGVEATKLRFPPFSDGFVFHHRTTAASGIAAPEDNDWAANSILELVTIDGQTNITGWRALDSIAGTGDAITASEAARAPITSYTNQQKYVLAPIKNNTAAVTIAIDTAGAKPLVDAGGQPLAADALEWGMVYLIEYLAADDHFRLRQKMGHGIWMRTSVQLRDVNVTRFGGDAIRIRAHAVSNNKWLKGSANHWMITGRSRGSFSRNGLFIEGNDTNAGVSIMFDGTRNLEYGLRDDNFLGNVHIMPHTNGNKSGSYRTSNPNARNLFLNPYAEQGQPAPSYSKPSMVIHGIGTSSLLGGINRSVARPRIITDVRDNGFSIPQKSKADGKEQSLHLGLDGNSLINVHHEGDSNEGFSLASYMRTTGAWVMRHTLNAVRVVIAFTTDESATASDPYRDEAGTPIPAGEVIFPKGYWVPSPTVPGRYRKVQ